MQHELVAYEEDFLEDGVKAVCVCGWMSERCPTKNQAWDKLLDHCDAETVGAE